MPFVGDNAWPISHFETKFSGIQLKKVFWSGVKLLKECYDDDPSKFPLIKVVAVSCDGAAENRRFINHHCRGRGSRYGVFNEDKYPDTIWKTWNPHTKHDLFFISDSYHEIKKLRNSFYHSYSSNSNNRYPREMKVQNKIISWDHIEKCYLRDIEQRFLKVTVKYSIK